MMMASRLLYGMSRQGVLPKFLSYVHTRTRTPWSAILFTTVLGLGLILLVSASNSKAISALGGTTALLLLGVFAFVNVAVLVLRRDPVQHEHFRANTVLSCLGAAIRSDERRVGKARVSTGRSRCSPYHQKKTNISSSVLT